jgi:hypothetical protein
MSELLSLRRTASLISLISRQSMPAGDDFALMIIWLANLCLFMVLTLASTAQSV